MMRKLSTALMVLIVCVLTCLGAGESRADTPLQIFTVQGQNFGTLGDHDFCRGAMHVGISAPKGSVASPG